jgi:hypothetical protein
MNLRPTPYTAAAAGVLAALAWPWVWGRFGGPSSDGSVELMLAMMLLVALPAHACVVGFQSHAPSGSRKVDMDLLQRIGAWLGAATVTSLLGPAAGWWT